MDYNHFHRQIFERSGEELFNLGFVLGDQRRIFSYAWEPQSFDEFEQESVNLINQYAPTVTLSYYLHFSPTYDNIFDIHANFLDNVSTKLSTEIENVEGVRNDLEKLLNIKIKKDFKMKGEKKYVSFITERKRKNNDWRH